MQQYEVIVRRKRLVFENGAWTTQHFDETHRWPGRLATTFKEQFPYAVVGVRPVEPERDRRRSEGRAEAKAWTRKKQAAAPAPQPAASPAPASPMDLGTLINKEIGS